MAAETFEPIPTCEVPPPIVEREGAGTPEAVALPRILLQAAGSDLHGRRLLVLAGLFFLLALFQATVLIALPRIGTLVVYEEAPRVRLVEETP